MQTPDAMVAEFAMKVLGFPQPTAPGPACNPRPSDEDEPQKPAKSTEHES
jgi:hypothetical protein